MTHTVVIKDRIYIPVEAVDEDALRANYEKAMYQEDRCSVCPYLQDRHSDVCDECPAFLGNFKLYNEKTVGRKKYFGISVGQKREFTKILSVDKSELEYKDKRSKAKFKQEIVFTGKLHDYQIPAVETLFKKKYGILEAPPRSGKCVTGDSYVFSERGMLRMEDVIKDYGYTENKISLQSRIGKETSSHFFKESVEETIKIETKMGYNIQGTPEHPLLVITPNFEYEWKKLEDITTEDFVCIDTKNEVWSKKNFQLSKKSVKQLKSNYSVTSRVGCLIPEKMSVELSRILGYFVANASLNTAFYKKSCLITFSSNNKRVQEDFLFCFKKVFGIELRFKQENEKVEYVSITNSNVMDILSSYGLKMVKPRYKEIPFSVLQSSKLIIKEYLSAYISCDSEIGPKGHWIKLYTASEKMCEQLHILFTAFGSVGRRLIKNSYARNGIHIERPYYSIEYMGDSAENIFSSFNILKNFSRSKRASSKYLTTNNVIPHSGLFIHNLISSYRSNSGVFNKGSIKIKGKIYDNGKKGLSKVANDLDYYQINKINFKLCSVLEPVLTQKLKTVSSNKEFFYDRIVRKEKVYKKVDVYDFTMPESHSFVCNGIVSHNTVMLTALMCKFGLKTLIIANQYDYLQQFYETMCGSDTQEALTNIPEIEGFIDRKICGICNTLEDFERFDVCLTTYQQFISEARGKKKLAKVKKLFGVVLLDEADMCPAKEFSKVMNGFESYIRIGCTGTTDRKDGRYFIVEHVMGPVTAKVEVETLTPVVKFIETGLTIQHNYKILAYAYRALANDKPRTELIVDWIMHDLKNGHSIVIPVNTIAQCKELVARVNERAKKPIACAFTAATAKKKEVRKQIILDARQGKYKVIVGIRKMVQRGINVPQWSCIYEISPISNTPNHTQEVSRILTPLEGKQQPLVRYFLDNFGFSRGCLRTCVFKTHVPMKHKIDKEGWAVLKKYTSRMNISDNIPMYPPGKVLESSKSKSKKKKSSRL